MTCPTNKSTCPGCRAVGFPIYQPLKHTSISAIGTSLIGRTYIWVKLPMLCREKGQCSGSPFSSKDCRYESHCMTEGVCSPTWDWDHSDFSVVRLHGLTQAKYTWPCKHWFLPSSTLWRQIHYYDVIRCRRQYGEKRMEINAVHCFFIVDFVHFASRRKIINHHVAGGTQESHPHVQDLQHPRLGKPRHWLQILDTRIGFPRPSRNMVIDSINLKDGSH